MSRPLKRRAPERQSPRHRRTALGSSADVFLPTTEAVRAMPLSEIQISGQAFSADRINRAAAPTTTFSPAATETKPEEWPARKATIQLSSRLRTAASSRRPHDKHA